MINLM